MESSRVVVPYRLTKELTPRIQKKNRKKPSLAEFYTCTPAEVWWVDSNRLVFGVDVILESWIHNLDSWLSMNFVTLNQRIVPGFLNQTRLFLWKKNKTQN